MDGARNQAIEVLDFWFVQSRPRQWFAKDPAFDALVAERVNGIRDGLDDAVVRLVVREIPRHVARDLDHKAIRDYKRRALHFQLDTRKPELVRTRSASGAGGARPSLPMLLREKLEQRPISNDVDRMAFVSLGMSYLERVSEPAALTAEPESETGFMLTDDAS